MTSQSSDFQCLEIGDSLLGHFHILMIYHLNRIQTFLIYYCFKKTFPLTFIAGCRLEKKLHKLWTGTEQCEENKDKTRKVDACIHPPNLCLFFLTSKVVCLCVGEANEE